MLFRYGVQRSFMFFFSFYSFPFFNSPLNEKGQSYKRAASAVSDVYIYSGFSFRPCVKYTLFIYPLTQAKFMYSKVFSRYVAYQRRNCISISNDYYILVVESYSNFNLGAKRTFHELIWFGDLDILIGRHISVLHSLLVSSPFTFGCSQTTHRTDNTGSVNIRYVGTNNKIENKRGSLFFGSRHHTQHV
jgi:hypothetical protein